MSRSDILSLAKQGNPQAIAALVNHSTKPQGITVQVVRKGDALHVLIEAAHVPNQQDMVTLILNSLRILKVDPIRIVTIYGRQKGEKSVAWSQVINLKTLSEPESLTSNLTNQPSTPAPATSPTTAEPPNAHSPNPPTAPIADAAIASDDSQPFEPSESSEFSEPVDEFDSNSVDPEQRQRFQDMLKRPEAVVLIIFVSLVLLWDLYVSLIEDPDAKYTLSGRELSERLGINPSTLSRRKDRDDFSDWTQNLDPDGIAWTYRGSTFVPKL